MAAMSEEDDALLRRLRLITTAPGREVLALFERLAARPGGIAGQDDELIRRLYAIGEDPASKLAEYFQALRADLARDRKAAISAIMNHPCAKRPDADAPWPRLDGEDEDEWWLAHHLCNIRGIGWSLTKGAP